MEGDGWRVKGRGRKMGGDGGRKKGEWWRKIADLCH